MGGPDVQPYFSTSAAPAADQRLATNYERLFDFLRVLERWSIPHGKDIHRHRK
ncbi:MAG: hypothetical protein HXY35_00260 [Chloroflexi bacterium]|nr:hypothetical protein [Chloroflexota bacterium]